MANLPLVIQTALDELAAHYESFEQNDRGANGYLFFATNRITKAAIAIKFYAGEYGAARHDEPTQLSAIRSKNVLPILDARNVSDEWGYFITPRCFEGDLDDLIAEQPSAHHAIDVALGICNGVSAIHALKMLHRDLKPGNIVLLNGNPQIADFGSVRILENEDGTVSASRHSILFRPPESFAESRYSMKGDLYQIGIVTFQILGGNLPYDGEEYLSAKELKQYKSLKDHADRSIFIDTVIKNKIIKGELINLRTLPPWIGGSAKRALRAILNPDPASRVSTIADVAAELTQIRASVANWQWNGDIAKLTTPGRIVEIRQTDDDHNFYLPYVSKDGGPFRKAPGMSAAPLAELVDKFSA